MFPRFCLGYPPMSLWVVYPREHEQHVSYSVLVHRPSSFYPRFPSHIKSGWVLLVYRLLPYCRLLTVPTHVPDTGSSLVVHSRQNTSRGQSLGSRYTRVHESTQSVGHVLISFDNTHVLYYYYRYSIILSSCRDHELYEVPLLLALLLNLL